MNRSNRSYELYREACVLFPGCVNSPIRAAVEPYPFFVEKANGAYIYTVDGETLIDYVLGYGTLILGHRHPYIEKVLKNQIEKGWLYTTPTEAEVLLGKKIQSYVMRNGMIRFVNSGAEATLLAIRLARAYTRRKYIIKFNGCYHGAHDFVLVSAGSAAQHYGIPTSEGVLEDVAKYTLVAEFNDLSTVEYIFRNMGEQIAAIITEPVLGNMGVIPPDKDFLKGLRELCDRYSSLLIFDEVITGFRLGLGGAQQYYSVSADIVTLGKIVGGGFPIGVVVARKDIASLIAPQGKVFNAGTFNAHPISMIAGYATIEVLEKEPVHYYARLAAEKIVKAFQEASKENNIDIQINHVESMFQVFFIDKPVKNASDARNSNSVLYKKMQIELQKRGVFIAPSQFEAIFTSYAHVDEVVSKTIDSIHTVFKTIKNMSSG
ncbi:MAG: glutamate-1-semialdehyde 2,1-aminomutase [Ignisphaera sp.]